MSSVEPASPGEQGAQRQADSNYGPRQSTQQMPIAVIGLAGRFPGDAVNARELWNMCCRGESAWCPTPPSRFNSEAYRHPDPSKTGCFNPKGAHFLKQDIGKFDAAFFGINPNEAMAMDPQQRLLLETTYEALENAGTSMAKIADSDTGVYVGASELDYKGLGQKDLEDLPIHHATGTSSSILSNRISYVFNLKGPSFTLDTACSSSLAALHVACQSLRVGDIDQAIVCGTNLILSPDAMVSLSNLRLFSEEGRCYTYDSRGTGYGRGEGVVSLILKPLSSAIKHGDSIRAVIRNTGANQDGKTAGITFPSVDSQAQLFDKVYASAGLDPLETAYVEAHGTGTSTGDPIEAEAISRVFCDRRPINEPLIVGSVKTNIGHLEAASGLAAMVKVILILENEIIPPNTNFERPNKNIPLEQWKLKVPTSLIPLPGLHPRRASISNFGFGGTNVHVIVEQYRASEQCPGTSILGLSHRPVDMGNEVDISQMNGKSTGKVDRKPFDNIHGGKIQAARIESNKSQKMAAEINRDSGNDGTDPGTLRNESESSSDERNGISESKHRSHVPAVESQGLPSALKKRLFVFSGRDKLFLERLIEVIVPYLDRLNSDTDPELTDRLAFTLGMGRSALEWKAAFPAASLTELKSSFETAKKHPQRLSHEQRIGFIFTGQGAQWHAMGRELLTDGCFKRSIQKSQEVLHELGTPWSLLDELQNPAKKSLINRPSVSQPATTAVQIALVDLLSLWDIHPQSVIGHSSGEIAAAYTAGILTQTQCIRISYHRGRLAEALKDRRPERPGGMVVVGASKSETKTMLDKIGCDDTVVACVNSPSLVTVSGNESSMHRVQEEADTRGLMNRRLKVDVAYHSSHMQDVADEYFDSIVDTVPTPNRNVAFHSSVKGCKVDGSVLSAQYWVENMTNPVDFVGGVESIYKEDLTPTILVEIGPHNALKAPLNDIMRSRAQNPTDFSYHPTLVRNESADSTMIALAGFLYESGCKLNLAAVNQLPTTSTMKPLQDLPSYVWNHSRPYWFESRVVKNHCLRPFLRSDLLGSLVDDYSNLEPRWRNVLRLADIPWLKDHQVQDIVVLPLTGYLCMSIEAMGQYAALHNISMNVKTQYKLKEIRITRPMVISDDKSTEVSIVLRSREEGSRSTSNVWKEFSVSSWTSSQGWVEHFHGLISLSQDLGKGDVISHPKLALAHQGRWQRFMDTNETLCKKTIDIDDVYMGFKRSGIEFGSMFRNITDAKATKSLAIATISAPDTSLVMPYKHETEHLFHPCAFDACFQAIAIARYGEDSSRSEGHMPTFVESITIHHGLLPLPIGEELRVHVETFKPVGDRDPNLHARFVACNAANKADILVEVEGFVATSLRNQVKDPVTSTNRDLCYQFSFEPNIDSMSPGEFARVYRNNSGEDVAVFQMTERLERAAFHYMQMNTPTLTDEELELVAPHLQKLYRFCNEIGVDTEIPLRTPEWNSCTAPERRAFLETCSTTDTPGRLLFEVGENLEAIIRGDIEPLSLMMRDGMLGAMYRDNLSVIQSYESAAGVANSLAFANPSMRILEIGAGTGGATAPMLAKIGRSFYQYDYTDLSTGFFESAKEHFQGWGEMIQYRRLNIEDEPVAQGFEAGSYDLVIASFVLHATANLEKTMRNVRSLLKTSGKLLIGEIVINLLSYTLIFGTLPGWWLGEEPERSKGPSFTVEEWHSVLLKTGFTGCDGTVSAGPRELPSIAWMISSAGSSEVQLKIDPTMVFSEAVDKSFTHEVAQRLSGSNDGNCHSEQLFSADLAGKHGVILTLDQGVLIDLNKRDLQQLQNLIASAEGILWVTRGARSQHPAAGMLLGFARSIRNERTGLKFVTLDLDGHKQLANGDAARIIAHVYDSAFKQNLARRPVENEYYEIDGIINRARITGSGSSKDAYVVRETQRPRAEAQQYHQTGRQLKLEQDPGQLESIHFVDDDYTDTVLTTKEVEISVKATGMNFKDLMISLGQIPFFHEIGLECSGVVSAVGSEVSDLKIGDRVCAMSNGSYARRVRTSSDLIAKMPAEMDYVQAASIPIVFCTAYYALHNVARLEKGESILIHAAAGGVGQACIMFAQDIGADVYATVGTPEKKEFIRRTYSIEDDHIFSSRHLTSLELLKGKGVDVIVNSTAGEMLHQSLQCLAPMGRFVEIGKRDIVQNSNLEMGKFSDSVTFASLDLGVVSEKKPALIKQILERVMRLFERKLLRPVSPITVYPISDIQKALRIMQVGKHIGKIVVVANENDVVEALPLRSPNMMLPDEASYIITGGTGGIGKSIIKWLASQGAKHIITASRSGTKQHGIPQLIEEMNGLGVRLVARTCDVAQKSEIQSLISDCCQNMPPIRGVIHGAMALRDSVFETMTFEDWLLNTRPKINGALNLHETLSSTKLDFFLMLSSLSSFGGSRGQAAYGASNAFLDAFAAFRIEKGLPAAVINIGMVESVGYIAENRERRPEITSVAHDTLTEAELLALIKAHITGAFGTAAEDQQTVTGVKLDPTKPLPPFASEPIFAHVRAKLGSRSASVVADDKRISVRESINRAASKESAINAVEDGLCNKLSSLLMLAREDVVPDKPIFAYGLDSLVAVELRNWITSELEVSLALMELMKSPSITQLGTKIASKSKLIQSKTLDQAEKQTS